MFSKKFSTLIISAIVLSFIYLFIYSKVCEKNRADSLKKVITVTSEDDLTIGDIEIIFQQYLDSNNINLKFGTSEYTQYIQDQMFDSKDKNLSKHPYYNSIIAYFVEYLIDIEGKQDDPLFNLTIGLTNKNKTISQIKNESIKEFGT